ncbi:MAG TPA: HEAT repeat domain-containing protein, partial [Chthoniobacteraceae bacterium]
ADGFRDPLDGTGAGILIRGNDLWWTCIPSLWHFKIGEGPDAKAETREKLLTGFGVHFALRGHDMHGLRFGPDGKLYFSIGDRGLHITTKEGKTISVQDTGSIMRCNPDGSNFEIFATGMRNPQELAFDNYGNLFTDDNNSDIGDLARFHYLVEGGDCGWRTGFQYLPDRGPWMREKPWDAKEGRKAKYIIPPVANIADGPSGITFNPGTGLSEKYQNRFFLSDFRGGASASLVHQIAIEPAGAFFKLKERRDFVKGILTTDVDFGVDGSLYVLDWVESWGGVGKGRIYKFTDPAANTQLQEETRKLIEEGMSKRPDDALAKLLAHPDMRVRQAAQFELAARDLNSSAVVFANVAKSNPSQMARLHAIWGLGQLAEKNINATGPLVALLDDPDAEVRAQAAHVLGDHHVSAVADKLTALLSDKENRVRFFAAMGISKINHKPAFDAICKMLAENADKDPVLRHGGVMALTAIATPEQLVAKASDASLAVRVGALLALRRQANPEIARFLQDSDQSVVLEAARAINDVPIEGAVPALAKVLNNKGLGDNNILSRAVNANYRLGKSENAALLASFASEPSAPEASRREAIRALADWAHPGRRDRILNIFRPLPDRGPDDAVAAITPVVPALLKDSPGGVEEEAAKLAAKLSIQTAGDALFNLADDEKGS